MHRLVPVLFAVLICVGTIPLSAQRTAPPPAQATAVVNLNSATSAQIASLPGIGLKTADLVEQYRQKNGPFKKIEEVMNVRGIGEKSFLRIKDRITVAEAESRK
jgi:competence protein ComEA